MQFFRPLELSEAIERLERLELDRVKSLNLEPLLGLELLNRR